MYKVYKNLVDSVPPQGCQRHGFPMCTVVNGAGFSRK